MLKFADKLAWAKEQFERHMLIIGVEVDNLVTFYEERHALQDDEDDALNAATQLLRFASEQIEEARRVLEEGA